MARARNIKPAFFDNEDLALKNCPLGRLLFIGLWTIADCNGNLEYRPERIKKNILGYDKCDIQKLMINLDKSGFIRFYSDGVKVYVNIITFLTHQNPHKNERDKGTEIPEYSNELRQLVDLNDITINLDKSGLLAEYSHSNPADSLIPLPDSLILNPETLYPSFDEFWKAYPKKKSKGDAEKAFKKLKPTTELLNVILEAIENQKKTQDWKKENGQYIPLPASWLNGKRWLDEVAEEKSEKFSSLGRAGQVTAMNGLKWLEETNGDS